MLFSSALQSKDRSNETEQLVCMLSIQKISKLKEAGNRESDTLVSTLLDWKLTQQAGQMTIYHIFLQYQIFGTS